MDTPKLIVDLLTRLEARSDEHGETLARIESDLRYHIKRTDLLEEKMAEKVDHPNYKRIAVIAGIISTLIGIGVTISKL